MPGEEPDPFHWTLELNFHVASQTECAPSALLKHASLLIGPKTRVALPVSEHKSAGTLRDHWPKHLLSAFSRRDFLLGDDVNDEGPLGGGAAAEFPRAVSFCETEPVPKSDDEAKKTAKGGGVGFGAPARHLTREAFRHAR